MHLSLSLALLASPVQAHPLEEFAVSSVQFASQVLQTSQAKNPVVSPLNLHLTIATLAQAASTEDRAEILAGCGLRDTETADDTLRLLSRLNVPLIKDKKGEELAFLQLGSLLLVNKPRRAEPETKARLEALLETRVMEVDFGDKGQIAAANRYIEERSHGRFKNALSPSALEPALIATTAVVKDQWRQSGVVDKVPMRFQVGGETVDAPSFTLTTGMNYSSDQDRTFVAIPAVHTDCHFIVGLPTVGADAKSLLTDSRLRSLEGYKLARVSARLPKLNVEVDANVPNLARVLHGKPLRVTHPIQPSALEIRHKVKMVVDENGFEGAALTIIMFTLGETPKLSDPIPFVADRPFCYSVVHGPTQQVLMLGVVDDPSAN